MKRCDEVDIRLTEREAGVAEATGRGALGSATVIVAVVDAFCPYTPTVPISLITCVPMSLACGVHENEPELLMF